MKKLRYFIIFIISVILLILLDQMTKASAVAHLKNQPSFSLIPGVFELDYLENRGAAFGMLQNQKWFFIFSVLLVIAVVGWCFLKMPEDRRYHPLRILGAFITAGAIGNMIDRVQNGYVVDFLYFSLIRFPVFNVADIYVTVSVFILFFLILTFYKDEDFRFLRPGRNTSGQEGTVICKK